MQVDEWVTFTGVRIAAQTDKAYLIAPPDLPVVDRDHCDIGMAMWVPFSQCQHVDIYDDPDQRHTEKGVPYQLATMDVKGWLLNRKVEEWPSVENAQILLLATAGIERDVYDKITARANRRRKF